MDQPRPLIAIVTDEQAEQIKAMMVSEKYFFLLEKDWNHFEKINVSKKNLKLI